MSLGPYLHGGGFTIGNEYWPDIADGHDNDKLLIYSTGGNGVRFTYTPAGLSAYRGSWDNATGTYAPRQGIIVGNIALEQPGGGTVYGWFSIALDRSLPQPPNAVPPHTPRIHVFVKSPVGGAPDEGSFTGQGN